MTDINSRMERLVRKMAITYSSHTHENAYDEARAIVAELDGNADVAIALSIAHEAGYKDAQVGNSLITLLSRAIAKGRELALAEVLPCDVELPPATVIKAGCTIGTLMNGLALEGRPKEFPATGGYVKNPNRSYTVGNEDKGFIANVGSKGKMMEINSVGELLRLINGGAKIENITRADANTVGISDKWDEIEKWEPRSC